MIQFRPMMPEDADEVFAMMRVFYDSPAVLHKSPDEVLRRDIADCLSDMPYIEGYVFHDGDAIVGYAMTAMEYTTEYGGLCVWLEDIYIKPPYRRQGIGSRFFTWLEARFRGKAVRYKLEVEPENAAAIAAYRKNGYDVLPYHIMSKELS